MPRSNSNATEAGQEALLRRAELKDRGWTEAMIRQILGKPDVVLELRNRRTLHLWRAAKVEAAEATPGFQERVAAGQRRAATGLKVAEVRRQATLDWVQGIRVRVPVLEKDELYRQARRSYEALWESRDDPRTTAGADGTFLDRIAVNFLRHECTRYEALLDDAGGRIGRAEAEVAIRQKVLRCIAEAYPYLAAECERQRAAA